MNLEFLKNEILGYGSFMNGPYGKRLITYADYIASGKCLRFLENYYLKINETYANTHTEDDYTGKHTTGLYNDAIAKIKRSVNATKNYSVIPTGTGATGAIEKLSKIVGIYKTPEYWRQRNQYIEQSPLSANEKAIIRSFDKSFHDHRPVVFISSYEHHSNELPWREGHAEVVKIGLDDNGLFDLACLRKNVSNPAYKHRLKLGSFSAASNVTGMFTPVYEVARIMHQYGGYVFFDFAACGPYADINMTKDDACYFDGIYLAMHKFLGGPSASGILVINHALYQRNNSPTFPGGGTVKFVTDDDQDYVIEIDRRETAGTPGIMQVIRAAMALELKNEIGVQNIEEIESTYIHKSFQELSKINNIEILGNPNPVKRLAVLSFNIRYKEGYLHHGFVSTLLNDLFGIQSRAGCACAGPYGFMLLKIESQQLKQIKETVLAGNTAMKPGWVRVNFHYSMDRTTFDYMISAIAFVAQFGHEFLGEYQVDMFKGTWAHKDTNSQESVPLNLSDALQLERVHLTANSTSTTTTYHTLYNQYLQDAETIKKSLDYNADKLKLFGKHFLPDIAWFYHAGSSEIVIGNLK